MKSLNELVLVLNNVYKIILEMYNLWLLLRFQINVERKLNKNCSNKHSGEIFLQWSKIFAVVSLKITLGIQLHSEQKTCKMLPLNFLLLEKIWYINYMNVTLFFI